MNSRFVKLISSALVLGLILVVGSNLLAQVKDNDEVTSNIKDIPAQAEHPQRQNSQNTIVLVSGKKLIIPPFPGLMRVDGLYPEIDDFVMSEQHRNKWAFFYPTEKAWVEAYNFDRQPWNLYKNLEEYHERISLRIDYGFEVRICNGKLLYLNTYRCGGIQCTVDIWRSQDFENKAALLMKSPILSFGPMAATPALLSALRG